MTEEDSKKPRVMFVDDWRKAWKEGRNNWHLDHVHPWVMFPALMSQSKTVTIYWKKCY